MLRGARSLSLSVFRSNRFGIRVRLNSANALLCLLRVRLNSANALLCLRFLLFLFFLLFKPVDAAQHGHEQRRQGLHGLPLVLGDVEVHGCCFLKRGREASHGSTLALRQLTRTRKPRWIVVRLLLGQAGCLLGQPPTFCLASAGCRLRSAAVALGLLWQRWCAGQELEVDVASVRDQPAIVARAAERLFAPDLATELLVSFICVGDVRFANQWLATATTPFPSQDLYPEEPKAAGGHLVRA